MMQENPKMEFFAGNKDLADNPVRINIVAIRHENSWLIENTANVLRCI